MISCFMKPLGITFSKTQGILSYSKGRKVLGRTGNPHKDPLYMWVFPLLNPAIPMGVLPSLPRCACNSWEEILAAVQSKTKLSLTFVRLWFHPCWAKHWEQRVGYLQSSACHCQHHYSKQQWDSSAKLTQPHGSGSRKQKLVRRCLLSF